MSSRATTQPAARRAAVEDLATSLQALTRLVMSRRVATRVLQAAGVTVSQQGAVLLRALLHGGQQPMAVLAASAGMDIGAVSRQVRLLEDVGAVERSTDPTDGRVALLDLTAEGRRMAESLRSTGVNHLDATIADWPEDDVRQLATLLDKLVAEMVATPVPGPD